MPSALPRLAHLQRWDRWRWGGLSPCRPSRWAAAGWQKWTPSRWVGRSQRCASASGWESARPKRSWCPGRGCTLYRCAGSDEVERESRERINRQGFTVADRKLSDTQLERWSIEAKLQIVGFKQFVLDMHGVFTSGVYSYLCGKGSRKKAWHHHFGLSPLKATGLQDGSHHNRVSKQIGKVQHC